MYKRWILNNKRLRNGFTILNSFLLLETIIYLVGIKWIQSKYSLANMTWAPRHLGMHIAYVFRPTRGLPFGVSLLFSNVFLDFLLPVFLAITVLGMDHVSRRCKLQNAIFTRSRRKDLLSTGVGVFLFSFGLMLSSFVAQTIYGKALEFLMFRDKPVFYSLNDFSRLFYAATKISLYFSGVVFFTYCIGLFVTRYYYLIYTLPLLLNALLVMILPNHAPSTLGFVESGLVAAEPNYIFLFIVASIISGLVFMVIRFLRRDEL